MRAKTLTGLLAAGLLLMVTVHPSAQAPAERKLQLSFDKSGLVTLVAQNVTVREILAEWTRLGGTQVTNADKLTGPQVNVQFEAQPEGVVLESLLRGTAGYILYPRLEGSTGASIWQSVSILPTSHPTQLYTPTTNGAPQIAPVVQPMPDDELPPVQTAPGAPAQTQTQQKPAAPPPPPGPGMYVPLQAVQPGTGPASVPFGPNQTQTTTPAGSTTTTGRGRGGGGL